MMPKKDKVEYEHIFQSRKCEVERCDAHITHYMIKKGTSIWQPVWCRKHSKQAVVK